MEKPLTEHIKKYLDSNFGRIPEEDRISGIALLAANGDVHHAQGTCTETIADADTLYGARNLVEHAIFEIHR
ncbi:MAG TPA: hypothetical protein ENI98_10090 [Gammaproteobacteria bacterium]|nr:hypothetical protein [Gammaproteobacteria bacterium]